MKSRLLSGVYSKNTIFYFMGTGGRLFQEKKKKNAMCDDWEILPVWWSRSPIIFLCHCTIYQCYVFKFCKANLHHMEKIKT